jgi:hypothetical protein
MAHDIFISYSSKDKNVADALCSGLETQGIRCWIAPRDVRPGQEWAANIVDAIEECKNFVVILSTDSNKSSQVLREVERAVNAGKIVIPFRIENLTPSKSLGYFLSVPHWLDAMTEPLEQHIDHLVAVINNLGYDDKTTAAISNPDHLDPTLHPSWSGTLLKKTMGNNNRLTAIVIILLTVIVLGLAWFVFYEQSHQPAPPQASGMRGAGMNNRNNRR